MVSVIPAASRSSTDTGCAALPRASRWYATASPAKPAPTTAYRLGGAAAAVVASAAALAGLTCFPRGLLQTGVMKARNAAGLRCGGCGLMLHALRGINSMISLHRGVSLQLDDQCSGVRTEVSSGNCLVLPADVQTSVCLVSERVTT